MDKKVLIAVDGSRHSANAVRYAAGMWDTFPGIKFVLFHVQPRISQYILDEARKIPKARAELNALMRKKDAECQQMLEQHKAQMLAIGVDEGDIEFKRNMPKLGAAKDILESATALPYDAVIMGRRGLSGVQEIFVGSVSADTVNNSTAIPIWLVDETGPTKNILMAVDGSENSLKAVDHLAFMLSGISRARVSFLHVVPRLGDVCPVDFDAGVSEELQGIIQNENRQCIDHFFPRARKMLLEAGVPESHIEFTARRGGLRVGQAVLEEFSKKNFGTLVVGRRGGGKTFFTGSVSRYLINRFSEGALWVVP